jgi:hypothetical protein
MSKVFSMPFSVVERKKKGGGEYIQKLQTHFTFTHRALSNIGELVNPLESTSFFFQWKYFNLFIYLFIK